MRAIARFIIDRPARSVHLDLAGLFYFAGMGWENIAFGNQTRLDAVLLSEVNISWTINIWHTLRRSIITHLAA